MITGVTFHQGGHKRKVSFKQLSACLPYIDRVNQVRYVAWGRRWQEPGQLPTGSHILLDELEKGEWENYFIRFVQLPILSFEIITIEGYPRWFTLTAGQYLQGVLVEQAQEKRIYILTLTPKRIDKRFERWPRIMIDDNFFRNLKT